MRWVLESLIFFLVAAVLILLGISSGVIRYQYLSGDTHIVLPAEDAK